MMLRGFWRLTWLELKIFLREPLGVVGTVVFPALLFAGVGTLVGPAGRTSPDVPRFVSADLPIFGAVLIALSAVLSLVTIVTIYREGGILKRLRATPLRASTILTAHVAVKLFFTALTLALMVVAGRRFYPVGAEVPLVSFTLALLFVTACVLSLGFLLASMIPTARFAQPVASLILYPMLGISGLFFPVESLPRALEALARVLPLTYAVSLLRGVWHGEGWIAHAGDAAVLVAMFTAFTALSSRVFRWE